MSRYGTMGHVHKEIDPTSQCIGEDIKAEAIGNRLCREVNLKCRHCWGIILREWLRREAVDQRNFISDDPEVWQRLGRKFIELHRASTSSPNSIEYWIGPLEGSG